MYIYRYIWVERSRAMVQRGCGPASPTDAIYLPSLGCRGWARAQTSRSIPHQVHTTTTSQPTERETLLLSLSVPHLTPLSIITLCPCPPLLVTILRLAPRVGKKSKVFAGRTHLAASAHVLTNVTVTPQPITASVPGHRIRIVLPVNYRFPSAQTVTTERGRLQQALICAADPNMSRARESPSPSRETELVGIVVVIAYKYSTLSSAQLELHCLQNITSHHSLAPSSHTYFV